MQQLVGDRSPATASVLLPILKKRKKKWMMHRPLLRKKDKSGVGMGFRPNCI